MKRKIAFLLSCILLAGCFTGCGKNETVLKPGGTENRPAKVDGNESGNPGDTDIPVSFEEGMGMTEFDK
ncbi:MAG: hypothetical protein K6G10_09385, partial [Butyrivibrio sp.]|nr:hypothetical protein [Butyrivibrio sp.]